MSFLAPFYLLAGLAITLPILFHMIRRTPQGRFLFSSVQFLTPSPPRMTRRSRINDWLLLLIRALAICLLAIAFARPFLRESAHADAPTQSVRQRILLLVDRSASMQRPGYWERALQQVESILNSLEANDQVSVRVFDQNSVSLMEFDQWRATPAARRTSLILDQLKDQGAGWSGTNGGAAMADALERLQGEQDEGNITRRIILVSDLQSGGNWDVLQGVTWPEDITVRVVNVSEAGESNASLQVLGDARGQQDGLRVRIVNNPSSVKETFLLSWKPAPAESASSTDSGTANQSIYVAPGQSRIVMAPPVSEGESQTVLELTGDDVDFDNVRYLVSRSVQQIHIQYLGDDDEPESPEGLRFFLRPLFPDSASRTITISNGLNIPEGVIPDLVIVGGELAEDQLRTLNEEVQSGRQVIFVARNARQGAGFFQLIDQPEGPVRDVTPTSYAMLGSVDLDHPVMKIFDDPRFSDFTKLKFWKYRDFSSEEFRRIPRLTTLAELEDGCPVIAEVRVGEGRVILFASGWNRSDSDLAVWSKFVPLMNRLLEEIVPSRGEQRMMNVGEMISLREFGLSGDVVWMQLNGTVSSHQAEEETILEKPGIYRFASTREGVDTEDAIQIAVNIPAEESRTDQFPMELLASMGVPLEQNPFPERAAWQRAQEQRQLMNRELESRQQWWRWLLAAGLGALLLETAIAAIRPRGMQNIGA